MTDSWVSHAEVLRSVRALSQTFKVQVSYNMAKSSTRPCRADVEG